VKLSLKELYFTFLAVNLPFVLVVVGVHVINDYIYPRRRRRRLCLTERAQEDERARIAFAILLVVIVDSLLHGR
jgi:hypothetical protein